MPFWKALSCLFVLESTCGDLRQRVELEQDRQDGPNYSGNRKPCERVEPDWILSEHLPCHFFSDPFPFIRFPFPQHAILFFLDDPA